MELRMKIEMKNDKYIFTSLKILGDINENKGNKISIEEIIKKYKLNNFHQLQNLILNIEYLIKNNLIFIKDGELWLNLKK